MKIGPRSKKEILAQARISLAQTRSKSPSRLARELKLGSKRAAELIAEIDAEDAEENSATAQPRGKRIGAQQPCTTPSGPQVRPAGTGAAFGTLRTTRLRLRGWQHSDIEPFQRHCNTASVMHHLGGVQTREALLEDIIYFMECERDGCTLWVAERTADNAFLGFCGLVDVIDEGSPVEGELEIGWRIRADEWRRGYAEEAAIAVLKHAFMKLEAEQVVARVAEANEPSRNLMRKLGMRYEPKLDHAAPTTANALVVYIIERDTWERSNALDIGA